MHHMKAAAFVPPASLHSFDSSLNQKHLSLFFSELLATLLYSNSK